MPGSTRRSFLRTAAAASTLAAGCAGRRATTSGSRPSNGTADGSPSGGSAPGSSTPEPTRTPFPDLRVADYEFETLPFGDWPQASTDCLGGDPDELASLVTFEYGGQEGIHVVQSARRVLGVLGCYRRSDEGRFLDAAGAVADALIDIAVRRDGAYFFPYGFDYRTGTHDYEAPWFSGMAQGIALSAFVRLYRHTGERRYLDAADASFASLARFRGDANAGDPWVSVVEDGYYWIEEYPDDPPNHTLNGMNFAIWGLYEYWRQAESDASERLLSAAVTTIAENVHRFRVEGAPSYYCLGHRVQSERYHAIHVAQLEQLYRLTGDETFRRTASRFRADA